MMLQKENGVEICIAYFKSTLEILCYCWPMGWILKIMAFCLTLQACSEFHPQFMTTTVFGYIAKTVLILPFLKKNYCRCIRLLGIECFWTRRWKAAKHVE